MSTSKNFKIALASSLLLTLVSCGGNSSSSKSTPVAQQPEVNQVVTSANWFILSKRFPVDGHAMVVVNDKMVLNECANKNEFTIDRSSTPATLSMPNFDVIEEGTAIKLVVTDCVTLDEVFGSDSVEYTMTKTDSSAEIVVNF